MGWLALYSLGPRKASTSSTPVITMAISCGVCATILKSSEKTIDAAGIPLVEADHPQSLHPLGVIAIGAECTDVKPVEAHGEL